MDKARLNQHIALLKDPVEYLAHVWQAGDHKGIALYIGIIRETLNDAEAALKDDMFRNLTAETAFPDIEIEDDDD